MPWIEALASALEGTAHPLPDQPFELEGPRGEVLAQAELAWPKQQLAVALKPGDIQLFTAAGWRCWSLEDPPQAMAAVVREALASP